MANNQQLLLGEGAGGGIPNYIEEVFNTFVWTGTGSSQTLTTGVDTATHGGLFWTKNRTNVFDHALWSTNFSLAGNYLLKSNTTGALTYGTYGTGDYVSNSTTGVTVYGNSQNYVTWTFRKQPKFFDVVTWTGTGGVRALTHNLGSVPGSIFVKKVIGAPQSWAVYHRSLGATKGLALDLTNAADIYSGYWSNTEPTATQFTVGNPFNMAQVDDPGATYVAYLFAHDAGGFGLAGTDNVISCGSFSGGGATVNLGWEPQWILAKRTDTTGDWYIDDNMRGWPAAPQNDNPLLANTTTAEPTGYAGFANITSTGFTNNFNGDYIYIAIRRGPMKVPTVGTSVFSPVLRTGTGATATVTGAGFPVDLLFSGSRSAAFGTIDFDRLRGATQRLFTHSTAAEAARATSLTSFAVQDGYTVGNDATDWGVNNSGQTYIYWNFRRAPGFFDEVCYTGTGVDTNFTHNLSVAPELIITKKRSAAGGGGVYVSSLGVTKYLELFSSGGGSNAGAGTYSGYWLTPTSTTFGIGPVDQNTASSTYVAYLFATCAGVSKVGTYTGNGSSQTIACGFAAGSRFVLIKRTDSTGDWYVWDSARGIIAGNDPHLSLNTTAAEVTTDDSVDTDNSGFIVNQDAATNVNVTSATYIFLAIA